MKQLLTARFWRSLLAFVLAMMMPFNAVAGTLQLPAAVKVVQEQAFMNNTSVDRVVLPEGATTIESKAFAGATALERVVIPETVTSIADDAFEGVEGLVVETPKDSYAWQWAKRNFVKVEDPNAPAVSAAFDQYNHTLYLGTGRTGVDIAKVVLTTELSENGTIEWKVEQVSEGEAGVEMTLGHPQQTNAETEATVLAQNISAAGESTWKITAETSDGSVWSETFNVKVAEMPASMPTQIQIPDPIITNVGERFEFIPSEMIGLNGLLPDDGNRVYKGISVSALTPYENLEFFEDGFNNAIAFTPSRVRNYSVRVHAIIANYVIVEETTIAIVDPNFAVYYNQRMDKVYLNTDCDEVWIADAFADVMLGEGESIEWTLTKLEGDSSAPLELRIIENGQCAEVWTKSLTATGTSRWQLDGVAPNGAAWSETFELTVEDLPDDLPTEILMPEVFTTDVGHLFQFMPSERLSHNGTIPEGVFWNYQLDVSGDLLENEKLAYPIDGRHVGFSFTPDSPAVYQFIVKLNVANYTIAAPARLIVGTPESLKVSYVETNPVLYLGGNTESAAIGYVSYDGMKSYPTIESGKIVEYGLAKVSGDDCMELVFDAAVPNEVQATNIVSTGKAVWRVSAELIDGTQWSEEITVTVVDLPENYPTEIVCPELTAYVGETFEFTWDMVSLNGEFPEDGNEVRKFFNLREVDRENESYVETENGFSFVPNRTGERPLVIGYSHANSEIVLNTVVKVVEVPSVEFTGKLQDTVYATGSANGFLLGNLSPQVELAQDETFEWSISLYESSSETPVAEIDFNIIIMGTRTAVVGLTGLSGETGTVTYAINVAHNENVYTYYYTLNVVEEPAAMPTGITVPETTYQIAPGGTLSLNVTDIRFADGEVPEGVSSTFNYDWKPEETTGLTIKNGAIVEIEGVTPGTYTLNACAAILNREYKLPITIEVKDEQPVTVDLHHLSPTLYLEGNQPEANIAEINVEYELAENETIDYAVAFVSGDEGCVDLYVAADPEVPNYALINANNVRAAGTSTWSVTVTLPNGAVWSDEITVTVANMPENYPTAIIDPGFTGKVGEVFEFDWDSIKLDGVIPEDGNEWVSSIGLYEIFFHPTRVDTENGFTFIPDHAGDWQLRITTWSGNHKLEIYTAIAVESTAKVESIHYFPTLYLEGNQDEMDVFQIEVDMELAEGEAIDYRVEKVSGDDCFDYRIDYITEDGLSAFVVIDNLRDVGSATLRASATLPDGTEWESEEFTVSVTHMPEDYPTELIVDYPIYGNVGERFEFRPSERVGFNGTLPDDGNLKFCFTSIYEEIAKHGTYEQLEDDHHTAFAFTPDKNARYGFSLYYYLGNHCLEHHGIIIIGDGNSSIGYAEADVMDTIFVVESEQEEHFWVGNAMLHRFHTLPDEEISWDLQLVDSSNEEPAVTLELTDTFEGTHGVNMDAVAMSGETGWVTYRVTASWDQSSWFDNFTINVVNQPEGLPAGITVSPDYYHAESGEQLNMLYSSIQLAEGEIPEGIEPVFEYWIPDEMRDEQQVDWTDEGVTVEARQEGRYQFDAAVRIGNYTLTAPIAVVIGEEPTNEADVFHYFPTLYLEGNVKEMDVARITVDTLLWNEESIDYRVEYVSGDKCMDMFIAGISEDGLSAFAVACNLTDVGQSTWQVSATLPDGTVTSEEITVTVAHMPEDYPTELIVEEPLRIEVGEYFEFKPSERVSFNGTLPEDGNTPIAGFPYIDYDLWEHPTFEWINDGENGAIAFKIDENVRYNYTLAYTLSNHRLEHSGTIVIGDGISDVRMGYDQPMKVAYTGIEDDVYAISGWVEGYALAVDEAFHWDLQFVEGEELAQAYINADLHGEVYEVPVIVRNVGDQTGTLVLRLSVTSDGGLELSQDFTIEILPLPEGLPTEISVKTPVFEIDEGDTVEFLYSDITIGEGIIPDGVEPVFEYWEFDRQNDVEWIDDGLRVTFHERGYYRGQAAAKIGNYTLTTPVVVKVGEDVGIMLDRPTTTHYINDNGFTWSGDLKLEGFFPLEDEHIEWRMERIDENEATPAEVYFDNEFDGGFGTGVYLRNFTGETGSMTYRFIASSDWGGEWSVEHTINVEHMPENFPTGIAMPDGGVVNLPVGDILYAGYNMIEFVGGEVPEGADVYLEFWPDTVEEYGDPFEWNDNGFSSVLKKEGRYFFHAAAYVNGVEMIKPVCITVGDGNLDEATVSLYRFAPVQFIPPYEEYSPNWVVEVYLENYNVFPGEELTWEVNLLEGDPNLANLYLDIDEGDMGALARLNNFSGETGSMKWEIILSSSEERSWRNEITIEIEEAPEGFATGVTMPNNNVAYLNPGDTLVANYDMIGFNGYVPEDATVYPMFWTDTAEEYGDPFEWNDNGFTSVLHEGRYLFKAVAYINGVELWSPVNVIVGDVSLEFDKLALVQYINPDPNSANVLGHVRLDRYNMMDYEQLHWDAEFVEGDEGIAELYLDVFHDMSGARMMLNNFSGDSGSMTWRIIARNDEDLVWSEELTFQLVGYPDYMPTGINMPGNGIVHLDPGQLLVARYDMISFEEGAPSDTDIVYFDFWTGTVEEFGDPFEWNEDGFTSVLHENGRYFFHAVAYVNGIQYDKQIRVIVGDGNLDEAGLGLYRFAPVQFIPPFEDYNGNWVVEAYLENYNVFPGEELMWDVELLEGDPDLASLYLDVDDGGKGALARLNNFSGETGSMTWAIHLTSSEGYSWTEEISFEIAEAPEGFATGVTMPNNNVAYLNPGDTLVANYDMIGFNGYVPEDATVYPMFWTDTAEEYGDPFEWNDNGFTSVLHEGRYLFKAVAYINGVELWSPVNVIVGDVSLEFDKLALVQYINPDPDSANMLGHVSLERYHMMDYERLHWDAEFVEGDEGIAELYLDVFHDASGARMMLNNFSGESGSMTWRIIARNDEDLVWSEELTFQLVGYPDYMPTGINMPGNGIVHLDPGQLLVARYDMISFEEGAPSDTDIVYFDFWTDTVEEFGDPFEWNEDGFASVLHENGRYSFRALAYINGIQYDKQIRVIVGDGAIEEAELCFDRAALVQYPNPNPEISNWLGDAVLENYEVFEGEQMDWNVELLEGDENLAHLYLDVWDDGHGARMNLNNFSGETGSMTWGISVQNEDGNVWYEEITFEVATTPDYLPAGINMPNNGVVYLNPGDMLVANYDMISFEDGAPSETDIVYLEFRSDTVEKFGDPFEWNEHGFTSVLREGRYFFHAVAYINGIELIKRVEVIVGSQADREPWINAQQAVYSMRAYLGAELWIGSFDVADYELAEGESYHWTFEKISDENESPVTLFMDGYYENNRGVNVNAHNVTGETGSVTYRLTVTTEGGLYLTHDVTVEMIEGRDDLPTGISVPRENWTVYQNNVIVLYISDVAFVDGVVLEDDNVWTDFWNLECLGEQSYGWDGDREALSIHFTELGTYELLAVKNVGGVEFYHPITINVVERGENDPYVDWTQDIHTIYTGLEEHSTWIGWGVLENYDVNSGNEINWRFDRIDGQGYPPVELYMQVFDDVHADIRYTNVRESGTVIYRLLVETSDGFMDSREFWLNVEELPENLPTELNMQTVYELEAGETFEFNASEITFANGEVPEGASERHHVINMDALYAMEGFEWTENGFKVPMNREGRYVFTFGKQIGNYTVSQDVVVLVGNAYPTDASLTLDVPVNTLFNDSGIEKSMLGYVSLDGFECVENEELYWNIERIDENEANPVEVVLDDQWENNLGVNVYACNYTGETGEVTLRVTASTNTGFSISEEFAVAVIEKPDNLFTSINVQYDHPTVALGEIYAISEEDILYEGGELSPEVTPYVEICADSDLGKLEGFAWNDHGFQVVFTENGRYHFEINVCYGGYEYVKHVYLYAGTGYADSTYVDWRQEVHTIYKDVENPSIWIGWGSLQNFNAFDEGSTSWNLERIDDNGGNPVELYLKVFDGVYADVRYDNIQETGSVTYRLSLTTDVGYTDYYDFTVNVEELPEDMPTELDVQTVYELGVNETFTFDVAEVGFANGTVPEGTSTRYYLGDMEGLTSQESFQWKSETAFEVCFYEEGRHTFTVGKQIGNYVVDKTIVILVGNGVPSDAWLEAWGTERTLYAGLEHCGWALDAEVRNYHRLDDEEFHWNLEHVDGPEMDIVRNEDAGEPWLGVWYDIRYTGDKTGRSVYRLTLDTEYGFHAEQYFVYHIIERPDDLPSDMFVPAEDIELQIGETYGARYEDMWLTDDGSVPEDAEIRHELHVPDALSGYHGYEWTDEGFKVTFTENGRYNYHAVIKVNGFEYRKEVRIIVGDGIADDVKMGFFYGFDGLHYINDNTQWIGDLWLENYNVFEGEGIHWNVWPTDETEPKANVYIDPVWNDGLNAAVRMDRFTGETGMSHYTVSVETDGGYYEEYEIEFELIDKPENFPEEIFVHQEDVYLRVDETYSARMNGFYWFNEGSVIPEGANHGAEFWPEELEAYHTFEWVEGGFDVTFTEPGRHHFYVNAAINGVDFTKEIRLHVGNGIPEDAHLNFEHAFVQHFINDQTQWIGDVHLENYLRFDNEEIRWEIEYLDEGEPLANVFIDPVWNDGMDAGVRVNDFRGEGEMNLRLRAFMDNNFSLFRDFSIVLLPMPENLPSDIVVEQEEIQLRVGETYEARTDGFAWFTDDGEIRYDIAEFFHEFYVGEELSNYHGFEWVEGGFNVTFYEEGRYHFYVAVTVNGVEYCKEIRLLVGDGMNNNARVEFHQATYTAYAAEEGDAWIGHAELEDYWVFDNEQVNWWVERIDENDVNPLNAYVANVWDPQYGANVHVDNFTGEIGEVTFRVWAESEYGFSAYTDFTVNVVEQPEGLPTILYVPSDNMTFNVGEEFVIHDYDLTLPEDCVIPENANLHYEYWDPEGTFYNQEVRWNEENGGVTVRFHREGRYEFTVSLLINTYRLTRTIRIVVGDGMEEDAIYMSVDHMIDPVYTGIDGACRIGSAYIENFNVFEDEDIEWTIELKNAEEAPVGEVFVSSYRERKLGVNFASQNVTNVGETTYVIKAVLPTGMELSEEITLHVEELPEGLPTELFIEQEEHNLMIGDSFTMMRSEVQFGEGFIPDNAAVHVELWPDENLENLPGFEYVHDEETGDDGINVRFEHPGEYVITVAAWIGNYMLFKDVHLHVTEPWKMALLVCSPDQVEEEYVAAMNVLETYGEEHVIVETFPGDFAENVDETIDQIVGFAENDAVKAIIVSQAVLGTSEAFRRINEVRPDMLLISGIPSEPIAGLAAQADIVMYADEVAQAQPMMDNCEAWGVDALVHYSFNRHMDNEVIAERYNRLVAIGQEKGIEVIYIETPDPIDSDDGFERMVGFIADNVDEVMAEREGQKVAFFGTNCGMQATLHTAVLGHENAYYPQPCCPSPYHGFGESLGLDLSFDMNPKDALRAIGNALEEYGAADRFATGALSVNMGIIEAAAQYAAGYAEGEITSQNDGDVINQMFNAKFGNPAGTSTDYDNVYAADVEIVTFAPFAGVHQAKIAVLTGSVAQGYEEYLAAQQYIEAYGEDRVVIDYYPDNFYTEEAYETIVSKITGFAEDPNVSAIIVMQSVPGTLEGFRQVRQMRDDVLLISGAPQEDMAEMSGVADVMLYSDEPAQAESIMDTCEKWEIDKFVHLSFERHMDLGAVSARYDRICERAEELGIEVIPVDIIDPANDFDGALESVRSIVDEIMAESEGRKVAFFSTNCGVQATLQSAVLEYGNAYYPQPCCPSPYHGFSESLGLELDPAGNHRQALRDIANALYGRDAVDRFSTCAMPVNMGIMEVAGKYAIAYANDELPRKHDSDAMQRLLSNTLSGADVSNEVFYNGYSILLDPVDFNDYAGVYEGKIAIVTGTENQGYEELLAAHRAMDTYGEQRVVLETYPDNFMDQQHEVADRIAALAEDPNVEAIVVMQSVPGTLEGFHRVRDMRDDMLLISGLPQENFDEMSGVADLMLFADEPAQAHPIMDKCEEWGVDAFVHLSFERHMQLGSVQARFNLICERAEEAGIEVIAEDIIDPSVNFNGALESVREAVDRIMTEYESQKVAFYSTNCGVQSALQSAVLEYDNAYYPLPCCPSPYHGFPETLGLELDLYDSKAAMRSIANALHELGAAHRFSTWASPVNMSIIDVAADYAIAYVDGNVAKGEEAETLRNLYAHRFDDARVDDTEFGNGFAVSFDAADFISYVNTDDMIQVWVAETMVDFTAEQFESFKQENEQYAHVNINIRAVGEGDAVDGMAKDPYYGADIFGFAQDQLSRMFNASLASVPDEYAEIIRESNDAGSVAAATMGEFLCAYPMTSDNGYFLYYDKSVVSDPSSLEAILADCEAAGKTFHMELTSGWYQPAFFFGTGCDLFYYTNDETGEFDNHRIDVLSENGLNALKSMIKVAGSPAFRNGSAAAEGMGALVSGTWASEGVREQLGDNYAAVKLPTVDGYQMSSFGGYKLLGVNCQESEYKQELCNAFAMYLTSESVQLARFELAGWGPSNLKAQQNEAVRSDEALNALLSQMEYAVPQGQYPEEYWEASGAFGERLVAGGFSELNDEELWELLKTYQEMLTSFIIIIA